MRKFFTIIGLLGVLQLAGAPFQVRSGKFDVTLTDRGGAILKLNYAGKSYAMPGSSFFTDWALANDGKNRELIENFGKLRFRKIRQDRQHIVFEANGVGAFDWLRMVKCYYFQQNSDRFSITYELTNRDVKAHRVGLRTRTFLRRCGNGGLIGSTVFQPRNGKPVELRHPGPVGTDEWSLDPGADYCAIASRGDRSGAVVDLPPGRTSALYSWFLNESTLEWFLREQKIAPGKTDRFTVVVACSADVPAAVAERARKPAAKPHGIRLQLPAGLAGKAKVVAVEPGAGVMPHSGKFIDATVKKQFNPSIRSVLLPAGSDPARVAVFPLENGAPVTDRPVPFTTEKLASGRYRVLFRVPEVDPRGRYFNTIKGSEAYGAFDKKFAGYTDFPVRITLDRKPAATFDPKEFAGGPDLVCNGSFERKAPNADGPANFWLLNQHKYRNYWTWEQSGGRNHSRYLRFEVKNPKFLAGLGADMIPEPGRRYTASAWIACDNRSGGWSLANIEFFDARGKELRNFRKKYQSKISYPWKKVEFTFRAPENAVTATFRFGVLSPRIVLKVDDVKIVPEDIDLKPRSKTEALRDRLLDSGYAPLPLLETISSRTVTPHVPWFVPAAEALPEVLFLCSPGNRQDDTSRREIVEFAQRHTLKFRYVPLLRKIVRLSSPFGILPAEFAPELETYTLARLKQEKTPKLAVVYGIDFKTQVQRTFPELLAEWQKKGCGMLLANCRNTPPELLGKRIPTPPEFFSVPEMRRLPRAADDRVLRLYRNGPARIAVFDYARNHFYLNPASFRGRPEGISGMFPAYRSREFPYWEYLYLPGVKALRYAGGIDPLIRTVAANKKQLTVEAAETAHVELRLLFKDGNRHTEAELRRRIALKRGRNTVELRAPELPGGIHIVEYFLSGQKGIFDSGAFRFDTPTPGPIAVKFASADRTFPAGTPVEFTADPGTHADLEMEIEDTDGRIVAREIRKNARKEKFRIDLKAPYTLLYRVMLRAKRNGRIVNRKQVEFSVPDQAPDLRDVSAALWFIGREFTAMIRNLGFDYVLVSFGHNAEAIGFMKALGNCNLRPLPIGIGNIYGDNSAAYRSDKASDPVRNPCYSDPTLHRAAREKIRTEFQKQKYRYYDARNYFLGDENFLGSTVCYSKYCLHDFRKYLAGRYPSLKQLNASWKSTFPSWDAVTPKQLRGLADSDTLAPWLEHKLFMTEVFADRWLGDTAKYVREMFPTAKIGLSGSQVPGYSYNWEALMKHIDCIAYYGGVQMRLIHDFGGPGLLSGRWSGGYVPLTAPAEGYEKGTLWLDLFRGANLVSCWHGTLFNGDVSPTRNLRFYSEALREIKRGAGKLFLSAPKPPAEAGILYSQPSLFAALATFGLADWQNAQSSWDALLTDLRLNYRFVPAGELEHGVPKEKLFILPAATVLSDRQIAHLREFVERGGTLLADFGAGCRDEHGNRRRAGGTAELFGAPAAVPAIRSVRLDLKARPEYGIPALTGEFQVGNPAQPVPLVRKSGKGKAILLNLPVNGYQQIAVGGVGGETDSSTDGSAKFRADWQHLIGSIARKAGVRPFARITDAKGRLFSGAAALRGQSGGNRVLGLIRYNPVPRIDRSRFDAVKIELPQPGHLYDVRDRKYLGCGKVITTRLPYGDAKLFAILKDKIDRVKLTGLEKLRAGETLKLHFSAGAGPQTFRVELRDPEGKVPPLYVRNVEAPAGRGEASFQLAFNDRPGRWCAEVTHVASGIRANKVFTLESGR